MKTLDIALKDLLRSTRSLFAIGMMFVIPLLITGLIYFAFGGLSAGTGRFNLPDLKVILVNQDRPTPGQVNMGQLVVDLFHDERIPSWIKTNEMVDPAAAQSAVDRQEAGMAVFIPPDFTAQVYAPNGTATVTIVHDPALTIGPAIVQDIIGQVADGIAGSQIALEIVSDQASANGAQLDATARQGVAARYGAWFSDLNQNIRHGSDPALVVKGPGTGSDNLAPANPVQQLIAPIMAGMLIFFVFFGAALTAQTILEEQENGTLARLFTTPTARSAILGGKFLSVLLTVGVQALVLILASQLAFRIQWGNPFTVAITTVGLIIVASGFGILLLSFVKNTRQGGPITGTVLTVMGMLGGLFSVVTPNMPGAFNAFALFLPQGWALNGWKIALAGGGPVEALLPFAVMVGMGAACFAGGVQVFRRRFA